MSQADGPMSDDLVSYTEANDTKPDGMAARLNRRGETLPQSHRPRNDLDRYVGRTLRDLITTQTFKTKSSTLPQPSQ